MRRSSTTMTLRRSFLDYDFASVNLFLHTPNSPNPCTAGWSLDLYPLSQGLRTTRSLKLGWSLGISPGEGVYFVSLTEHRRVVVLGGGISCGHLVNGKFLFFSARLTLCPYPGFQLISNSRTRMSFAFHSTSHSPSHGSRITHSMLTILGKTCGVDIALTSLLYINSLAILSASTLSLIPLPSRKAKASSGLALSFSFFLAINGSCSPCRQRWNMKINNV